ncbi:MAG: PorV/PorQ family protein [Bacteroidota bacterium]
MKHLLTLTFGLTLSIICYGQQPIGSKTITTGVPFLNIHNDPAGAGMGELGVVAAPDYYGTANQMNPALLARGRTLIGGNVAYSPWLRALGIGDIHLTDVNFYADLDRIGIGINARRFDLGQLQLTGGLGQPIGTANPVEQQISTSVALRITDNLSAGVGLQYFESDLSIRMVNPSIQQKVRSIATNMGLYYQDYFTLAEGIRLRSSWGVSILDLGPKITYTTTAAARDFIPINLAFGVMEGVEYDIDDQFAIGLDFGFQGQKLMVPSEGGRSDLPLLSGMFGSFTDAPFAEEIRSINWQLGTEARLTGPSQLLAALRGGVFIETPEFGNRNFATLGGSLGIMGLRLDMAYIWAGRQPHPLQNTLRMSFGYTFVLD